ncbi:MAG: hypothetical protein ABJF88_07670 [Rhodothermales bacterium]
MRVTAFFALLVLCTGLATTAQAQSDAQDVTIVVPSVNAFEIPTNAVTITVVAPAAGQQTGTGSNASTGYNLTTNNSSMKITGQLDALYPTGISLQVLLGTPTASSGGSAGTTTQTTLSTSAQDLITGISRAYGSNVTIGYTASATAGAVPNAGVTQTVTYTLTN